MRVIVHPEVHDELRDAARYLKIEKPSIAKDFPAEVKATLASIGRDPQIGSPGDKGTRRKYIMRFRYTVIYRIDVDHVFVLALSHHRRDPDYWHHRL